MKLVMCVTFFSYNLVLPFLFHNHWKLCDTFDCSCCFLTIIKIKKNLKILLINENITVSSVQIYSKTTMLTPKKYYVCVSPPKKKKKYYATSRSPTFTFRSAISWFLFLRHDYPRETFLDSRKESWALCHLALHPKFQMVHRVIEH